MSNAGPRLDLLHQLWEMVGEIDRDPIARKHFDLDIFLGRDAYWGGMGYGPKKTGIELYEHFQQARKERHTECGTVGCVIGFASICVPAFKGVLGFNIDELARLLGITYASSYYMFVGAGGDTDDDSEYIDSPEAVQARIKEVIYNYSAGKK